MAQNHGHGKFIKQGRWWNVHGSSSTDLVLQWEIHETEWKCIPNFYDQRNMRNIYLNL